MVRFYLDEKGEEFTNTVVVPMEPDPLEFKDMDMLRAHMDTQMNDYVPGEETQE